MTIQPNQCTIYITVNEATNQKDSIMSNTAQICQDIQKLARLGQLSANDFNKIYDSLILARNLLDAQNRRSLSNGDRVTFFSSRQGVQVTGVIDKVKRKKAIVSLDNSRTRYDVPLNMLEKV